jgi:hypothetical protein
MRTFLIASGTEFVSYFLIVVNTRAYSKGLYFWTFVTDAFFISQAFFVAKWMVEAKEARGLPAYLGFLFGGTLGSLAAIFVTKIVYGG